MQRIVQANIERFELLLKTEKDPTKRAMIICLLAEQNEAKRRTFEQREKQVKK